MKELLSERKATFIVEPIIIFIVGLTLSRTSRIFYPAEPIFYLLLLLGGIGLFTMLCLKKKSSAKDNLLFSLCATVWACLCNFISCYIILTFLM